MTFNPKCQCAFDHHTSAHRVIDEDPRVRFPYELRSDLRGGFVMSRGRWSPDCRRWKTFAGKQAVSSFVAGTPAALIMVATQTHARTHTDTRTHRPTDQQQRQTGTHTRTCVHYKEHVFVCNRIPPPLGAAGREFLCISQSIPSAGPGGNASLYHQKIENNHVFV